jgi:hypothetical protein
VDLARVHGEGQAAEDVLWGGVVVGDGTGVEASCAEKFAHAPEV